MAKPKKSIQQEFIRSAFKEVAQLGEIKIETTEPKKIKEALSRFKQERSYAGTLFFEADAWGFTKTGEINYLLTVTYIKA